MQTPFSAGFCCAHIKNACRQHEPTFLNLLLCLQNSVSRKNTDLREMNKHVPPPLPRAPFQPLELEVGDGAQRTPQAAGSSRGCGRKILREKRGKKKAFKKIIITLVYRDMQQEVLLSSRELSLLKKTWNENSGRELKVRKGMKKLSLQSTGGSFARHPWAKTRLLQDPPGCLGSANQPGNGGMELGLQWKILPGS